MRKENLVHHAVSAVFTICLVAGIGVVTDGSLFMMGLIAALCLVGWYCTKPLPPTIFGALAVLALAPPPADAFVPPPPEASVVRFYPADTSACTGFHIGRGLIATAGHCVKSLDDGEVVFSDGSRGKARLVAYLTEDGLDDLAVYVLDEPRDYPAAAIDCGPPATVRTEVYLAGFPKDYVEGMTLVWGRVSGWPQPWSTKGNPFDPSTFEAPWTRDVIPVNLAGLPGVSGGPVFSVETGKVVGVLVGAHIANRNLDAMVPSARLCQLLGID